MKKIIILILPVLLFSCFWESDEIKQAKEELLWNNSWTTIESQVLPEKTQTWEIIQTTQQEKSYYNINYLTDKFIDIEPINNIESIKDSLDIKWVVNNPDIDKIIVTFENSSSTFPKDVYTLQTFKKWDDTFLYRAYKKYDVLDNWLNKYTIDAYVWENLISKIELEVFIASENSSNTWTTLENNSSLKNQDYVPKTIWTENDNVFLHLPVDENNYWSPIMTWESWFTYSNVSNFEVSKNAQINEVTCENFGDYLSKNYTWYFWNTCRPIYEDSFWVNVLTLTWDKYKYEKHYIDKKYNLYWVVLLESWEWLKQSDMQAKNEELKTKNYEIISKTDKLFKDLLK